MQPVSVDKLCANASTAAPLTEGFEVAMLLRMLQDLPDHVFGALIACDPSLLCADYSAV
ncbi:hypothetical protein [Leucobacter chromiireducens]|uniref:hypothetical protein n=1 Tax=Leucobacter chromiireducens TaxID=283877 RepID=UPI001926F0E6|nr:hypothetical protein [Leucobacter chromiireducens]